MLNNGNHTQKVKMGKKIEVWYRLRKNPGAMISLAGIILVVFFAIFADVIADYGAQVIAQSASDKLQFPSLAHWFGTDRFGRDIFARIVHGARAAVLMGVLASFISVFVALILSSLGALYGGVVDNIVMRIADVMSSIPALVIALAICAGLGQGLWQLIVALSIQGIPYQIRIIRSKALTVAQAEYIEAVRSLGAGTTRILFKHLFPNLMSIIIVNGTSNVSYNIIMGATLSFIGIGIKAPNPEWGMMLSEGMVFITNYPYLVIIPGMAIVFTALCINTFGDYLRDALDPQLKGRI